jgi:uracil-DNA glycosylase
MSRIFINYRRQDSEGYVGRLHDHLLQHFNSDDIFMDVASIEPGVDFVAALETAVAGCDVFISVIGPQWLTLTEEDGTRRIDQWNDFVRIEIASALKQNKVVIPVLVGRAKMPAPSALPEDLTPLTRRNAMELNNQHFKTDVDKLVVTIRGVFVANPRLKPRIDSESLSRKEAALKQIRADLVNATDSPLYPYRVENRYFPVMGEGSADASIMFIGESPGKNEAETGKVFVGPSGDVLDEMLKGIGIRRQDVFITNALLDHPSKRDPFPHELEYYGKFVDRLIDVIQPAVIATLGRFAMSYLMRKLDLPEKRNTISQLHGKLIKTTMPYGEIHIVPLYHPAVVLYSASQREVLRKDFEKLKLFI